MLAEIASIQSATAMAVGIIIGLGAIGTALAFSYLGAKLLETTARQPEMANELQLKMFIVAGLIDAVTMIGIGICLWFSLSNPFIGALLSAA